MGEIVNLRRARKDRARREREKDADAKRAAFGRSKDERSLTEANAKLLRDRLDAQRREDP
jgi:hypothetical protein